MTVLAAPLLVLSDPDGQLRPGGAQGVYAGDIRVCDRLEITVEGAAQRDLGYHLGPTSHEVSFHAEVRSPAETRFDAARPDTATRPAGGGPVFGLVRRRRLEADRARMVELIELREAAEDVLVRLALRVRADLAATPVVRSGARSDPSVPSASPDSVRWSAPGDGAAAGSGAVLAAAPAADSVEVAGVDHDAPGGGDAVLGWSVRLRAGTSWSLRLTLSATASAHPDGFRAATPMGWRAPTEVPDRLAGLLARSLADLDGLLLADPLKPSDRFIAAGSPWYCTLFGRDALWSARLLLALTGGTGTEPADTEPGTEPAGTALAGGTEPAGLALAGGTLRALGRRQGRRDDERSEEQPGKIVHEVRPGGLRAGGLDLPPRYYGTIDATALWCVLLHDAWRAGLPEHEVAALLANLELALSWSARAAERTGFLAYSGSAGSGLANQGWKDSRDGVCWADGAMAERPLALCEVQGYAYAAALGGAELLAAFGRPGADRWREWAGALAERFRAAFWIDGPDGSYPAIALDAAGRAVTGAASNMAHLLSTGLLTAAEAGLVADRLARPDLDCRAGLRTLSAQHSGFDPLSYHRGSVWPHDTAIAVLGLAGIGRHDVARPLAEGLVRAAGAFDDRLPELYGIGQPGDLLAYPTACRPQAWAAAGAVAVVGYLSGWPLPAWAVRTQPIIA